MWSMFERVYARVFAGVYGGDCIFIVSIDKRIVEFGHNLS